VFLILLWALYAPLVPRPVLRPVPLVGGALVVLLLPLAAESIALWLVVATIALTCASIVAVTITRAEPAERS
jgi:hypothetical protein